MKTTKLAALALAFAVLIASLGKSSGQNSLQFTGISVTDEGAMQLHWASQSNEVYEIDEADSLIDTNTGTITWNKLYDDYPSQGTNTFIGDFGNYNLNPQILHPKNTATRFYRIVDLGPDELISDEPTVTITSVANGALVSGALTVTVAVATDLYSPMPKLYVDGQEMWPSDDGTNFVINTCEWGNGPHVLFATVKCLSGPDDSLGSSASQVAHGVSPFVPVIFSNLVTRISFSEPFFQPELGQTQQVSAVFAANSDWTLTIRDAYSNAVRTVTGSGNALQFNWDGTGNGGTNIPAGVYYYYISAQTNGQSSMMSSSASMMSSTLTLSPVSEEVSELWALPPDGSGPLPLAIFPPGTDTNGFTIFEATPSDVRALTKAASIQDGPDTAKSTMTSTSSSNSSFQPNDASGGSSAPASQTNPAAPQRPPTHPVAKSSGSFGYGYQDYQANGDAGFSPALPQEWPIAGLGLITMDGFNANATPPWKPLKHVALQALNFGYRMGQGGWSPAVMLANDQLTASALRSSGSGNPFNNVDIGLLCLHGAYSTKIDYTANGCKQMYFPITSGGGAGYVRMSEMNFGGSSPTNGLKWMALLACNSLYQPNWNSMKNAGIQPYNSNLHMFLGADTTFAGDPLIGQYWADFMLGDPKSQRDPIKIRDAWYQSAIKVYKAGTARGDNVDYPNPTRFTTVADSNCTEDYLQTYSTPGGGGWNNSPQQVYP
jgi:hypothetical protein